MVDQAPSDAAAAAVAGATSGVNSSAPTPGGEWHKDISDELVRGHLENRGWHKLDPKAAITEAVKAQQELQKALGVPAEQMARLPKDASDKEAWTLLNQRLGVPTDKSGYKLHETGASPEFAEKLAEFAHETGLRPEQAEMFAKRLVTHQNEVKQNEMILKNAAMEAELKKLHADWGALYETNDMLAGRMAQQLGIEPADLKGIKENLGVERSMKLLLKLAQAGGEAPMHEGQKGGGQDIANVRSPEQAQAWIAEKKADPEWCALFAKGDKATVQSLLDANNIILEARRKAYAGFMR